MSYNTYLFDFDYTLADSSRGIVICFRNVLTRHGYMNISDETIKRTIGKTLEDSFSILTGVKDEEQLKNFKKEYVKEADTYMTGNTVLFLETKSVLTALKDAGASIGIISTKYRYRIKELLEQHFPSDFFNIIIGGEDVTAAKPSPEGILLALKQLHCTRAETLYIGDSTVDAETAKAAKVDFAGVLHGMTTEEELKVFPHKKIMKTLNELLENKNEDSPNEDNPPTPESNIGKDKPRKKHNRLSQRITLTLLILFAITEIFVFGSYYLTFVCIIILISQIRNKGLSPRLNKLSSSLAKWYKKYIRILRIKQTRGNRLPINSTATTTCRNCGNKYTGNYCNRCGQSKKIARFSFRYIIRNALGGISNIDNGFWRTLIELLYRPGYMINDFIRGKRVHYFRPFQTLFVLAAIYILLVQLIDPEALKKETSPSSKIEQLTIAKNQLQQQLDTIQNKQKKEIVSGVLNGLKQDIKQIQDKRESLLNEEEAKTNKKDFIVDLNHATSKMEHIGEKLQVMPFLRKVWDLLHSWAHGNKAASIIYTLPLFALATRMAFRKRKYSINFNITEHVFIQTYIAAQILLLTIIYLPFNGKAAIDDLYDIPTWSIFLLFWWDYKQLFHTTWLKSFFHTVLMFFYSLLIIILVAIIVAILIIAIVSLTDKLNF